eukprot:CAMPEP_0180302170 /NCGR_PEP_ID=MMETSP0988-20121125/24071_1 /TAXON_ID=697907 /ORGANISM="non described non described, Strain CCMP2293" /LENGTH=144 /DNA_ID=CAMNT_0022283161 /DNA_START=22 /DNA_END=452 /DNA_ORIENTATION=+
MACSARRGLSPALALLSMAALLLVLAPRDSRAAEACGKCSTGFFLDLPGNASSTATTLAANVSNATNDSCGVCVRCPFTTTADAGAVGNESCVCMPGYARSPLLDDDMDLEDENMTNSTDGDFNETNATNGDFNETNATDVETG